MSIHDAFTLDHLERLSDHRGLFEHAKGVVRREEHGYCTDDNARLLVVTAREPKIGPAQHLGRLSLAFVLEAQDVNGRSRNRMDRFGRWTDRATTDDCWGRGLWALGVTAAHHGDGAVRKRALLGFNQGVRQRSNHVRSMAFAALGAAEVLVRHPDHRAAHALLLDAVASIGPTPSGTWRWPERRLTYANALLPETLIAAGAALNNWTHLDRGLAMLEWLLGLQTPDGHLSVVGTDGRGPDDHGPQFDQQPIEVAALADACWRAYELTGDRAWSQGVAVAAAWFAGDNDAGLPMHDPISGGGFDGLHRNSVNLNQGAESTLAFISTMQRARSFATTP